MGHLHVHLSLTRAPTRHAAQPSHARQRMQLLSSIGVRNSNTARRCEVCLLRRQKGTCPHSRDSRWQWIENVANVNADLEPFWHRASGGRRWLFFRRRLQHAQLEVLPELRKGDGCLSRGVEELRAVHLLRGHALVLVLAAALLAAHADVSIDAAQRQPLAAGLLKARLLRASEACPREGRTILQVVPLSRRK